MVNNRAFMLAAMILSFTSLVVRGVSDDQEAFHATRDTIRALHRSSGAPGLAVSFAAEGKVHFIQIEGRMDLEHRGAQPLKLRIGSLSKVLTATAAARLHEENRLGLDDPLQRYVAFPEKGATMTSRQLLGHLAGIRHYTPEDYVNRTRFESVTASLPVFSAAPLVSPPGSQYHYSSYGYTLLSAVIERASGMPFLDALNRLVLQPAGMTNTVPDRFEEVISDRAGTYERIGDGEIRNAPYIDLSDRWAASGMLSSPGDLASFAAALMAGRIVSAKTLELMLTPQKTTRGEITTIGLGWRLAMQGGSLAYAYHGGDAVGGRAFFLMMPQKQLAVAIVANLSGAAITQKDALALLAVFEHDLSRTRSRTP